MSTLRMAVIAIVYVIVNVIVNINNLIPQHPRHIGDMQPSVTLLGDELGELDSAFALHLDDEVEERLIRLLSADPLSPSDSSPSMGSTFGMSA